MTPIIAIPIIVPGIVATPPAKEVPPITQAAIASGSYPVPIFG